MHTARRTVWRSRPCICLVVRRMTKNLCRRQKQVDGMRAVPGDSGSRQRQQRYDQSFRPAKSSCLCTCVVHSVVNLIHDLVVRLEIAAHTIAVSCNGSDSRPDGQTDVLEFVEVGRLLDIVVQQRVEVVRVLIPVAASRLREYNSRANTSAPEPYAHGQLVLLDMAGALVLFLVRLAGPRGLV